MKLTAKLALSQLKVNRRRSTWTFIGILLSTAMLTTIYNLGYGSGMHWVDRITIGNAVRDGYLAVVSSIAIIMSLFVISISIIVISNAFRVSATERLAQFGILKSTGATKKQITQTVIYEGMFLTVIAIPVGIIIGLIFQLISINIINSTIGPMLAPPTDPSIVSGDDYLFKFIISTFGMMLSIVVSLFTVFLSAYLPARKAAKVPAINAIRGTGEVKIKNKKIRTARITRYLFKTEGMLAKTFLKRSSKNFRATVIAMSFSIAIFIISGSIFTQVNTFATNQWENVDADYIFRASRPWQREVDCELYDESTPGLNAVTWHELDGTIRDVCLIELTPEERGIPIEDFINISDLMQNELNDDGQIFSVARTSFRYNIKIPRHMVTRELIDARRHSSEPDDEYFILGIDITAVNPEFHEELAALAGVASHENILINHGREWDDDMRLRDMALVTDFLPEYNIYTWDSEWTNVEPIGKSIEVHGMISGSDRPSMLNSGNAWNVTVVVPIETVESLSNATWYVQADDELFTDLQDIIFDYFEHDSIEAFSTNLRANDQEVQDTLGMVMFFLSAFVAVLILIALTNVISTISENVKTRSKEFAVLQSIGMTSGGIKRMLNLESIFASINAIFIGVPLGILGSYGIFISMANIQIARFPFPYLWILVAIIAVFFITWITMQFAAHKLKDQNIIETIRNGSGK